MRHAILMLHRKVDGEKKCICGASMGFNDRTDWYCKRQMRNNEPSNINLEQVRK